MTPDTAIEAPTRGFARPPYDGLTIVLHWTTLALVLVQLASAWLIDHGGSREAGALALSVHRSSGSALWLTVAFRLLWRLTGMRLPPFPPGMGRLHITGVHLSEYGLYLLLLVQPLTGLADTLLRGRPFALFIWTVPALLVRDKPAAAVAHLAHMAGAWALIALVTVHALAALTHKFVLDDGVLESMIGAARRSRKPRRV
jgi:cytochrome b561